MADTTGAEHIEITPETIGHALKDNELAVPIHQRSYKWEKEQITDLYQDLAGAIKDNLPEYFLGSIVVVKGSGGRLEVNDGQQRLATSLILVAAIRDYFFANGDSKSAKSIEAEFILTTHRRTADEVPKLTLNVQDREYFLNRILRPPDHPGRKIKATKESHRRIDRAASLAATQVNNIVKRLRESDRGDELHNWVDFLEFRARIIQVKVHNERMAYLIFETMNDRGLQLSSVDLLKNRLYMMADDRIDEAIEKWQSMTGTIETLPRPEETQMDYVRHTWIALYGHVRDRFLYDKIRETIKTKQAAIEFSNRLATNAPLYAALFNPSSEIWASYPATARKQLAALASYGVKQVRPMLLAALEKFDKSEVIKLLDAAVCWTVRCLMSNVGGGSLEVHYNRRAHEIMTGVIASTSATAENMREIVPDDARFRSAVSTASVGWAELARYYLQVLQREADAEPEPQYIPNEESDVITLEHIIPQDLDAPAWQHIPKSVREENYQRLGNLVLLQATANSDLRNSGYDVKSPILAKSNFSLTKKAGKFKKWGPEEIADRQEVLADLAVKAWPLRIK